VILARRTDARFAKTALNGDAAAAAKTQRRLGGISAVLAWR
jgi:hypothetical protein